MSTETNRRRTFGYKRFHHNDTIRLRDLLGLSIYNYGSQPLKVFGFVLRAYDANRGPDVYVLDTLTIPYVDDLEIELNFTGTTPQENNAYVTFSVLKTC